MRRKKNNSEPRVAFYYNPHITIVYEMKIGTKEVLPGTRVKVKNRRGTYQFMRLVSNSEKNIEWVDLRDEELGSWLSVRPSQISGLVYKRSYKKKVSN